jgi:hypothetical protein
LNPAGYALVECGPDIFGFVWSIDDDYPRPGYQSGSLPATYSEYYVDIFSVGPKPFMHLPYYVGGQSTQDIHDTPCLLGDKEGMLVSMSSDYSNAYHYRLAFTQQLGVALDDYARGATAKIVTRGVVGDYSGLSVGQFYYPYYSDSQQISLTKYSKPVGIALSATELMVL